ncbi:phage portal protein [Paludibacterium sp. dN 18-1]|uniref:Phage portal protein n=1 Tax=Paludibacterium denitrificans TaxID=2675226 RepID=A0A844GB95_9NEIS|nr:phage portal protein [Paludibacterium denitrificans]
MDRGRNVRADVVVSDRARRGEGRLMFISQQFGVQTSGNPDPGWISSLFGHARSAAEHHGYPGKSPVTGHLSGLRQPDRGECPRSCRASFTKRKVISVTGRLITRFIALVHEQPNAWQTAYEFTELSQVWCGTHGNSYSFIERGQDGRPTALIPRDPKKVSVFKGSDNLPYYQFNGSDLLPQRNVHHVRWFSTDGYVGASPVALHCDVLGLALATNGHASAVFASGTNLA